MNRINFIKKYLLALLVFNLAACSTLQPVSVENAMKNSLSSSVDYGSLVEVKTLDKQTAKFRVTVINADGLGGNKKFYRYEDMASLKVEAPQSDNNDTWMIIGGILGAAALVFLIANADSVSVCSPAPCDRP
jgi:starvation-inducible outer membrane lipoprotein